MPYAIVKRFEETIAEYAGSKYAVAVNSCCNAILLSCIYKRVKVVSIPKRTYPGVANAIIHAGGKVIFNNTRWHGVYNLSPYLIVDGALRFKRGMFYKRSFHCLSFHGKKHLNIGSGGMILTEDKDAYEWLKKARFDGRSECPLSEEKDIKVVGWNMYMTPEQAARGLDIFNFIKDKILPDMNSMLQGYPDLSKYEAYKWKN